MTRKGFTLVELIVVVAIVFILALIGVPLLNKWIARNSVKNFAYALSGDISYSRIVAKKDGVRVTVAVVNADTPPQDWTTNSSMDPVIYLVFEDKNNNGIYDPGEKIISYGKSKDVVILSNDMGRSCMGGSGKCIVFFPVGTPLLGSVPDEISVGSKNYEDIEYKVILQGITGITNVKRVK